LSVKPTRDGKVKIKFNQDMQIPDFVKELKNKKPANGDVVKGRELDGLAALDVSSFFELNFNLKSDEDPKDM
jgi:hypothetical protein